MALNWTRTRAKGLTQPLLAAFAMVFVVATCSSAGAQSGLDRIYRDKLHRAMDCGLDCDMDWSTWALHRSPDFTVRVSFRREPIAGAKVTLTSIDPLPDGSGEYLKFPGVTEVDGIAQFYAVPPGRYIAHVNQGLLAQSQDVVVETGSNNMGELRLEWPMTPIATRSLRGSISAWERANPQSRSQRRPLTDAQVQLFDLRSGELLGSIKTTEDGYYEFPDSGNGLYVVRVTEGQYPDMNGYDQAVEVASNAVREEMPGLIVDHVCANGLAVVNPRSESQDPCVPVGAQDPMPPITHPYPYYPYPYVINRAVPGAVVIIQPQVVVIR